jgi:nitroreductase
MDAIECLKTRRSIRAFTDEAVPTEVVEEIIDCARLAPSAVNRQPWQFVAVRNGEVRKQIADACDGSGEFIAQAPVCIAVFCEKSTYYLEDGCAATQNILLAAHAVGLGSCWVAGDKKPHAETVLHLLGAPENHTLVSLIALGKAAQEPQKPKKSLGDLLYWERFA